ncbi:hypothetical protein EBU24_00365 [bacterium]|nr:hypothetical protein [bacterium]
MGLCKKQPHCFVRKIHTYFLQGGLMLKVYDMFSGIGGFALGFQKEGFEIAAFAELDKYPSEVLAKNFPSIPNYGDVTKIKYEKDQFDVIVGGFPCFPARTPIQTKNGIKSIEDVIVGDLVLTHELRYKKVIKTMSKENAPLISIQALGFPKFFVTEDHPFFARKCIGESYSEPEWVFAKDLKKGYYLAQPIDNHIPSEHDKTPVGFWYMIGRWLGDGWLVTHKRTSKIPQGKRGSRVNSQVWKAIICTGKSDADTLDAKIKECGFKATRSNERTGSKFHISSKEFVKFLEPFGRGAENKLIPEFVIGLSKESLMALWEGLIDSDGYKSKRSISVTTISPMLAYGIARIIRRLFGQAAGFYFNKKSPTCIIEGRTVNQKSNYDIKKYNVGNKKGLSFSENGFVWTPIRKISEDKKTERVFNLSVDGDESYVANSFVVHNCTDISIASKTKEGIYGKRSFLWKEFFRAVGDVQPKYCVIENVQMLVRRGLNTILSDLASIGYDATYTTLDAQFCGTAQRRRRIYILGVRDGIPANSDIFEFSLRNTRTCQQSVQLVKKSFEWNFEKGMWFQKAFAYFTRQRSDQFDECGVASTLTKRDYKSFTDLVVSEGNIRRVTPTERLRLMGFPDDWHIEDASLSDKYKYNGMHVPSVRYIARCLKEYEKCLSFQK